MRIPIYLEFHTSDLDSCIGFMDINEVGTYASTVKKILGNPNYSFNPGGVVTKSHHDESGTLVVDDFELTHMGLCIKPRGVK